MATSDATATTVNSHHPSITQGTIVTTITTVQPSPVCKLSLYHMDSVNHYTAGFVRYHLCCAYNYELAGWQNDPINC